MLKTGFPSEIPVDCMFTSMGLVGISSRIFRTILSFGSASSFDEKTATVFVIPGVCAITRLNCSTKSHAFHNGVGIIFFWKSLVTDLLSVKIKMGSVAPQKICPNYFENK